MLPARKALPFAAYLFFASTSPSLPNNIEEGYAHASIENFASLLNREAASRKMAARLDVKSCKEGAVRTCIYDYRSVALVLISQKDTDAVGSLTWICAKDCESVDLLTGVTLSLRVLEPDRHSRDYIEWTSALKADLPHKKDSHTTLGETSILISTSPATGIMIVLGKVRADSK